VKDVAEAAGMPYVNHRWLGGLLTNFQTINQRIRACTTSSATRPRASSRCCPRASASSAQADLEKLRANLGGVKYMQRTPDAMFVIDLKTEAIAGARGPAPAHPDHRPGRHQLRPDGIDFVVPGNDDAIKSCAIVAHAIGDAARDGRLAFTAEAERQRAEEEERVRREAEQRAQREAESRRVAMPRPRPPRGAGRGRPRRAGGRRGAGRRRRGIPGPRPEAAITQEAQRDEVQADVPHPAPTATDQTPDPAFARRRARSRPRAQSTTADAEAQTEPTPDNATQEQNA
jgi:small subunit ribosomal protein S2